MHARRSNAWHPRLLQGLLGLVLILLLGAAAYALYVSLADWTHIHV